MIRQLKRKRKKIQLKILILLCLMIFTSGCGDSSGNKEAILTKTQNNPGEVTTNASDNMQLPEDTDNETEAIPGTTLTSYNQSAPPSSKKTTSNEFLNEGNISKDKSVILSCLPKIKLAAEVKSVSIFSEKYPVESFPETNFAPGSEPIISDGVFAAEDVFISVLLELEPLNQASDPETEYNLEDIMLLDANANDIQMPPIFIMSLSDSIKQLDYTEDSGNFFKISIRDGESSDVLLGFLLPASSYNSESLYLAFGFPKADAWYISMTDIISRED